jgi:type VI secretion system secreted protein VgrG
MIKGWKLKFGQLFKFVEKVGIWLSDPSGNEIHLDEETKSTTITAPETATIRARNIIFEATESITFRAGTHISETATLDKTTVIGGILKTNVAGNKFLYIGGEYNANVEGDYKSHTEKDRTIVSTNGIETFTEGAHKNNAKGEIHHNSNENTKHN